MTLKNNKILYISTHNPQTDPGVENKIAGLCRVAAAKGYEVDRITMPTRNLSSRRVLMKKAVASDARIIMVRSLGILTIIVYDLLRKCRKQGKILICDQPTPLSTTLSEVWHSGASMLKRVYNIGWGILSGPWAMWPYNRIIEYAPESKYFSLGNKKRILLIGNGIDVNRIQLRNYSHRPANNNTIRLLGVANTAVHHGFDRVIRAIAQYNSQNKYKAYFKIIGGASDSPVIKNLKDLAKELGVEKYIEFCGFQNQQYISDAYTQSDLAIGSLGLSRIGLKFSSILKVREYCLAGIPFITAGEDPDFPEEVPFRFVVPNDESIDPIVDVLEVFHEQRKKFTDADIREYALTHFSFESKFDMIMNHPEEPTMTSRNTLGGGNAQIIRLLGVANTTIYHGFDRIINAMAAYNKAHTTQITFDIVGGDVDSKIIKDLKQLSRALGVDECVTFHGFRDMTYIAKLYDCCDMAVGALGLHRKNLKSSAILKIREYCLAGIPFITAGEDPDFPEEVPFRFVVPNDESIEPIVKAFEAFPDKRELFTDEDIRNYALNHLSFEKKFDQIMEGLI